MKLKLVSVSKLRHIEGFSAKRVEWLKRKILKETFWTRPIIIDKNDLLVMDGQHRLEVALALGLKKVPCVLFDYKDVKIWSLRPSHKVTRKLIKEKALSGNVYPYKTVKHEFPIVIESCQISITELAD
jgi:hypothetical protein